MDEIPLFVRIAIPTTVEPLRGRLSTSPPYGAITSFRITRQVVNDVQRARLLIDPSLTFNMFMHLSVGRVARAICEHNDRYQQWVRETINEHDELARTLQLERERGLG